MPADDVIYRGSKFSVLRRAVVGADGAERPLDFVAHPGAAVILPILDDGRVVMIRNHRFAPGVDLLELPAGTIDPGESPAECARREVAEETGYVPDRLTPLAGYYSSPGICTEMLHAFVATGLRPGPTSHEPLELIRVLPMEYADALRAVGDGRILDAKTMVALLYYDRFVRGDFRA